MKGLNLIGADKYGYGQKNYAHAINDFLSIPHTYNTYTHIYNTSIYKKEALNHILVGLPSYKKPDILTVHDVGFNYPNFVKPKVFAFLLRENIRRADRIIVFSRFMKNEIERFYKNKDITILPFGFDLGFYTYSVVKAMLMFYEKEYDVLIVSNLEERKNLLPYLEVLSKTWLKVRLIGKTVDVALSDKIRRLCADSSNIEYSVSVPDIRVEYAKSRVLLHPSFYGGFEIPIAESSLMNLNTLLYDYPLNRELYGNAPNYLPYELPTKEEMEELILKASLSYSSQTMKEIVRRNNDIENIIKGYEKFYEECLQ